ncbi:MAG: signal peptidase I [bacterium]|nr:signal peptidase I [bacterium]
MKKILKELYPYLIIIVVVVLIRSFIVTPVRVDGSSMDSTLNNGNILILNKFDKTYDRFDIVVINAYIDGKKTRIVKRIIGLPLESVEYKDNDLYINGKLLKDKYNTRTYDFSLKELYGVEVLPKDCYFVLGDNRTNSRDSRDEQVKYINKKDIVGKTSIRIFPFTKIGKFN